MNTVAILTDEPYHDNSTILGVYPTWEDGINAALAEARKPDELYATSKWHEKDWQLEEWDIPQNKKIRIAHFHRQKPDPTSSYVGCYFRPPFIVHETLDDGSQITTAEFSEESLLTPESPSG